MERGSFLWLERRRNTTRGAQQKTQITQRASRSLSSASVQPRLSSRTPTEYCKYVCIVCIYMSACISSNQLLHLIRDGACLNRLDTLTGRENNIDLCALLSFIMLVKDSSPDVRAACTTPHKSNGGLYAAVPLRPIIACIETLSSTSTPEKKLHDIALVSCT